MQKDLCGRRDSRLLIGRTLCDVTDCCIRVGIVEPHPAENAQSELTGASRESRWRCSDSRNSLLDHRSLVVVANDACGRTLLRRDLDLEEFSRHPTYLTWVRADFIHSFQRHCAMCNLCSCGIYTLEPRSKSSYIIKTTACKHCLRMVSHLYDVLVTFVARNFSADVFQA